MAEPEVRALIRRLSRQNPLWGAPRIHGEPLKLGYEIVETIRVLGIEQRIISYGSPWMNGYVEWVIVFGERHLRRVRREYAAYHHGSRTRLGLGKDAPEPRAVQPRGDGPVVSAPVLGGLHHRHWRDAA